MIKNINASRIRELKRKILHEHNQVVRNIYRDHITYLESQN
jgi:hypothetical protein